jgi:hypothetical protein
MQSEVPGATVATLLSANKVLRRMKQHHEVTLYTKKIEGVPHFYCWSDASWANRKEGNSTGGYLIGIGNKEILEGAKGHLTIVNWATNKLKRVARSSLAAELQAMANAEDELHLCRATWLEINGVPVDMQQIDNEVSKVPGTMVIDAKSIYDVLTSQNQPLQLQEKRTALELVAYLQNTSRNNTITRWVHGGANLADGLTKVGASQMLLDFLRTSTWTVVYDPSATAGRKRTAQGKERLESATDFAQMAWEKITEVHPDYARSVPSSDSEDE